MALLNTTWRHVRRSPYQAFAAIFIMSQTFFVISCFTFMLVGSAQIITYFESVPQISAFFKDTAKTEDVKQLEQKIKSTQKTKKVEFISKEQAYGIYKQQFKDDPLLLELVTADILPASLKISTHRIDDLGAISDLLKKSAAIDKVIYQQDIVNALKTWTNALRKVGVGISIVLALDAIFLMAIIIGIKISQKKDEIEIMRLLGATSWYVRWPFLFEGMLYGIVGALIGWFFASVTLWYITPFLMTFLGAIPVLPAPPIFLLAVLGGELLLAIILGIFSSFLAVLRYLK